MPDDSNNIFGKASQNFSSKTIQELKANGYSDVFNGREFSSIVKIRKKRALYSIALFFSLISSFMNNYFYSCI